MWPIAALTPKLVASSPVNSCRSHLTQLVAVVDHSSQATPVAAEAGHCLLLSFVTSSGCQ